jgi:ABC-2 type transport system ATP-binding protein
MTSIGLNCKSLNVLYKKQKILDNIELNLSGNQTVTLLGPNGAGKSTLLKIMADVLYPQTGTVELNGINAQSQRLKYLSQIGYMPEMTWLLPELSVLEQLQFMATMKAVKQPNLAIEKVMDKCQLQQVANKRTHQLSLGYRQRLNLAQAIINQPRLIIMDEPLNGLDPHLIIEFREIIEELKQQSLVIISTHYLAEAQLISDRVLIMQQGKLLDNSENQDHLDLEKRYMQLTLRNEVLS